jgi:hypothetical protein
MYIRNFCYVLCTPSFKFQQLLEILLSSKWSLFSRPFLHCISNIRLYGYRIHIIFSFYAAFNLRGASSTSLYWTSSTSLGNIGESEHWSLIIVVRRSPYYGVIERVRGTGSGIHKIISLWRSDGHHVCWHLNRNTFIYSCLLVFWYGLSFLGLEWSFSVSANTTLKYYIIYSH